MAFPASSQTLADALRTACNTALGMQKASISLRTKSAAGPVNRSDVVGFMATLAAAISTLNSIGTLSGIGAYAQTQLGSPTLDVSAEFTNMVTAAAALRDWISTNFPKDATSGAWLLATYDSSGVATQLQFTTAQLAQLRTLMSSLESTIA